MVRKITWQKNPPIIERIRVHFKPLIDFKRIRKKISKTPPLLKWIASVIIGGFIFKVTEAIVNTYIHFSFQNLADVTVAFRTQFLIDLLLVFVIFILLITVMDIQRRYG